MKLANSTLKNVRIQSGLNLTDLVSTDIDVAPVTISSSGFLIFTNKISTATVTLSNTGSFILYSTSTATLPLTLSR